MKHHPATEPAAIFPDNRFRDLLGSDAWLRLPSAVRARFGKRLQGGASIVYQGVIENMQMNFAGRCLAQVLRLVGAPLPYHRDSIGQPAVVVVSEDVAGPGQFWVRKYGRKDGFPQVVHSSKRFSGPSGLEEYIGYGIGMTLQVEATGKALLFKSAGYFIQIKNMRIKLPKLLSPGQLTIGHHDLGERKFRFSLELKHRLFGKMVEQDAVFWDSEL